MVCGAWCLLVPAPIPLVINANLMQLRVPIGNAPLETAAAASTNVIGLFDEQR